jgi:hypothetical protein
MGQEIPELELKMGWKGCYETSVRNYRYMLRNVPEERKSHTRMAFCYPHEIKHKKNYSLLPFLQK